LPDNKLKDKKNLFTNLIFLKGFGEMSGEYKQDKHFFMSLIIHNFHKFLWAGKLNDASPFLYPNRNVTRSKLGQFPLTRYRKFTNLSHTECRSVLNIARDYKGNDYENDSRVEPLNVLMHILICNHTATKKTVRAINV